VEVAVELELIGTGHIKFIHETIPNIVFWEDMHAHFRAFDRRIPLYGHYIEEESRPDHANRFRVKNSANTPDTLGADGGVAGGTNAKGQVLPPVIFPRSTDTTGVAKMQTLKGIPGLTAPADSDSETETDSEEDQDGDDTHKLR
jgi:hypothetical protein